MRIKALKFILLVVLLISCSQEEHSDSDSFVIGDRTVTLDQFDEAHPKPEKMPYADTEAQLLQTEEDLTGVKLPESLELLQEFLEDETRFSKSELSFLSTNKDRFYAESLSSSQLLLLDVRQHRLAQYDVDNGGYEILAPEGRGPGDIQFAQEIQLMEDKLYIPMGAFRVSIFTCNEEGCEYNRTINTELNNYSIAQNNDHLAILSQPMYTGQSDDKESYYERDKSVNIVGPNDEIIHSFMPIYDHQNPILRGTISVQGSLRSFSNANIYTVLFSRLPYLYIFDNTSFELYKKYEFQDYTQGYMDVESDTPLGAARERHNDQSYFTHSTKIDDEWLLITKRERINTNGETRGMDADESYIYYGFNTNSHTLYKIGEEPFLPMDEQRTLTVTDHGLVINREGSVYWVGL